MYCPSGLKATPDIGSLPSRRTPVVPWGWSGSVTFQTLTSPDAPPPVSRRPSGLNASDPTHASLITFRCFGTCGSVVFHRRTSWCRSTASPT